VEKEPAQMIRRGMSLKEKIIGKMIKMGYRLEEMTLRKGKNMGKVFWALLRIDQPCVIIRVKSDLKGTVVKEKGKEKVRDEMKSAQLTAGKIVFYNSLKGSNDRSDPVEKDH
jgi:hypothetical protein